MDNSPQASILPHPRLAYRPAIDGLRAISVLGVLLFHFERTWLPGGFAGVDVFFVISGYLITRVLLADHGGRGESPSGGVEASDPGSARPRKLT